MTKKAEIFGGLQKPRSFRNVCFCEGWQAHIDRHSLAVQ